MSKILPHPNNFCGNGFPDWLEVNLLKDCNAKCEWCVERRGWHPRHVATWQEIVDAAIATGRKNIILLGGEPTLHPDLSKIISRIRGAGRKPWITTNGSKLTPNWVIDNLVGIEGVNISIHDYDLYENEKITGLWINETELRGAINEIHDIGAKVRLNCNCIKGHIDTEEQIENYISWAKYIGADNIRFAELKHADGEFVDLAEILDHKYGTNDNPFELGCSVDAVINDMSVNFRLMCGMQTSKRPCPVNPDIMPHPVLYYDGRIYSGWQQKKESDMTTKELAELMEKVKSGEISTTEAVVMIDRDKRNEQDYFRRSVPQGGGSCQY